MKAALRARLKNASNNWTYQLPWVLLGLRTAFKEDLQMTSAELVFGEPLMVSGDFVGTSTDSSDPALLLGQLQEEVQQLRPVPTSQHGLEPTHVPEDIKTVGATVRTLKRPFVAIVVDEDVVSRFDILRHVGWFETM